MSQFRMNLEFVNVIATDSKILEELNSSKKKIIFVINVLTEENSEEGVMPFQMEFLMKYYGQANTQDL